MWCMSIRLVLYTALLRYQNKENIDLSAPNDALIART
jgi:hypothetical protein